eukprot:NODE_5488_length_941_cov_139.459658_g5266_i0.p1 GENE.NODE_5488_length_941_cov_139.459658_g5266_i0~~NODE_5488_length_941_cov_139.459658_g5266_i0.p1  ORF type:complete len:268 (-),score=55.62 NODE_5488_length_941_cov_139.459658_g5266_i0:137-877(-)
MDMCMRFATEKCGVELDGSKLAAVEGDMVNFLVTQRKQDNYLKYCSGVVEGASHKGMFPYEGGPFAEPDAVLDTIRLYTDHTTGLCTQVNLSLAADSPSIKKHADYIVALRDAIFQTPLLDDGCMPYLYRGVELADVELAEMERLKHFFIPSFTSTSSDRGKAYDKNALLVIKPHHTKYAATIVPEMSKFYDAEKETLFACYTSYRLERVETVNKMRLITLSVDDFATPQTSLSSTPFVLTSESEY